MDGFELYNLLMNIIEYVPAKERETAIYSALENMLQVDEELVYDFKNAAMDEDNTEVIEWATQFINNNCQEDEEW